MICLFDLFFFRSLLDISIMRQQQSQIDQFHSAVSIIDSRHTSFDGSNAGYEILDPGSVGCFPGYQLPKKIQVCFSIHFFIYSLFHSYSKLSNHSF